MSDKKKRHAELIATASVNVSTPTIAFNAESGFKKVLYNSLGVYTLELEHGQDPDRLVVEVTQNNTQMGDIVATVVDGRHIQVSSFNGAAGGGPGDSSFYITVHKIGSH